MLQDYLKWQWVDIMYSFLTDNNYHSNDMLDIYFKLNVLLADTRTRNEAQTKLLSMKLWE